jgi:hypothetical protein
MRFYFKTYDGGGALNNNSINSLSGTASLMSGINGLQHNAHIIIKEYAIND